MADTCQTPYDTHMTPCDIRMTLYDTSMMCMAYCYQAPVHTAEKAVCDALLQCLALVIGIQSILSSHDCVTCNTSAEGQTS